MSLTSSLFTGVSGLTNQGNAMQVIGDNISNVNTLGFKGNRFTFSDLLSQSVATQSGTSQVGRGVGLGSIDSVFEQGSLESTGNTTDLSIGGDGFFIVRQTGTDLDLYTRAGNFNFNKDGELTNELGYIVQGWKLDDDTGLDVGSVGDIVLQGFTSPPKASTRLSAVTNLDADSDSQTQVLANSWNGIAVEPDPFIEATAYEYQTVVKAFDSLGSTHDITIYYDKKSGSDWEYIITMNPAEDKRNLVQGTSGLGLLARGTIEFNDSSGAIDSLTMDEFTGRVSNVRASGAITEENTVFTLSNVDAVPVDGLDFSLEFDGSKWDWEDKAAPTGIINALDLPQTYRNAKIISGDANSIQINLDGDPEKTVDLEIKFKTPAQATDALQFDIMQADKIHIQDVTDTRWTGDTGNDNTQLFIDNPNVLTVDATGLNIIWDASAGEWYWSTPTLQNVTEPDGDGLNVDLTLIPAPVEPIGVTTPVPVTDPEVMKFYSKDVTLHWDQDGDPVPPAVGPGPGQWSWRSPNARELSNVSYTGGINATNVDLSIADVTLLKDHSTGNSLFWDDIIGVTGLDVAGNFTGDPSLSPGNTVLSMPQEENLIRDSTPTGGYTLTYDPTAVAPAPVWSWGPVNDPVVDYPNRQIPITGDQNSVSIDLTGDGTDIKLDFPTPLSLVAGGTISFDIDSAGEWNWNMPTFTDIQYLPGDEVAGSNTEMNIINPAAVNKTTLAGAGYDLIYTQGAANPWSWLPAGSSPTNAASHRAVVPGDPTSGPYAAEAFIINTENRVTIDLTGNGEADIEYNFTDPLDTIPSVPPPAVADGGIKFRLVGSDTMKTAPVEYAGGTILAGSNEDVLSVDLTGNGVSDLTYSFIAPLQANGTINFDIDTHIPPDEYQNAVIMAASSDAGKINIDLDNDGASNMLFTFEDSAPTPVAMNVVRNSTFSFDIDPRVPPAEYANAAISGDEKQVALDMNNDTVDDIRFTFTDPLPTGPVTTDSEILFNIEGTTAWSPETTNKAGYFEFTTDFLGGEEGATVQKIELDVGTKDDGTGQFVNDSLSSTQFARPSSTVFQSADGFGAGDLQGVDVSSDGIITGIYSNGELIPLYRVALAKFLNNQGLFKQGNNLFRETRDSGNAITNRPGENGLGSISPNSLEMSNVDVANEFVKMITTQRGFQANSKIITTVDSMLSDVIQMKR